MVFKFKKMKLNETLFEKKEEAKEIFIPINIYA